METLEDELERAKQERQAIVRKYKLGRNLENQINQWVSFSVTRRTCQIIWIVLTNRKIQTSDCTIRLTGKIIILFKI